MMTMVLQCGQNDGQTQTKSPKQIPEAATSQEEKGTSVLKDPLQGEGCDFSSLSPARMSHFIRAAVLKKIPEYPTEAIERRVQGQVIVKILVNRNGDVEKACVIKGPLLLQAAAKSAAMQWKFKRNFGFTKAKPREREVVPSTYVEDGLLFNFTLDKAKAEVGITVLPNSKIKQ